MAMTPLLHAFFNFIYTIDRGSPFFLAISYAEYPDL